MASNIDKLRELLNDRLRREGKPELEKRAEEVKEVTPEFELDDDGEEYQPVGIEGVLAASERLLAINRGLVDTDERDSMMFQKIVRPHAMFREGIKMDAGKIARSVMYQAAKRKNLSGLLPGAFDPYIDRVMKGNPLTSPLEEINPMQLVENSRRITKMGPGGLASSQSITNEAQAVHPSQYSFISTLEGPECFTELADVRVFTSTGWVDVKDLSDDMLIACNIDGIMEFHKPIKVIHEHYKGDVYTVRNAAVTLSVTPNHRFYYYPTSESKVLRVGTAARLKGKYAKLPATHIPYDACYNEPIVINGKEYAPDLLVKFLSKMVLSSVNTWAIEDGFLYIAKSEEDLNEMKGLIERLDIPVTLDGRFSNMSGNESTILIADPYIRDYIRQHCIHEDGTRHLPEEIYMMDIKTRQYVIDQLSDNIDHELDRIIYYKFRHEELARDIERLFIGLGYSASLRKKRSITQDDKYDYRVRVLKSNTVTICVHHVAKKPGFKVEEYDGMVHCATVPGGMLLISTDTGSSMWVGNSERAGIDVRAAWGTKVGSNGRIYQKFYDRRKKKFVWLSPEDVAPLAMKIPD